MRKPQLSGRHKRIPISLSTAPPYWRDLTSPYGFTSYVQRRDWLLVLSARGIPWRINKRGTSEHLYVPPLMENIARQELTSFLKENTKAPRKHRHPAQPLAFIAILLLLPLVIWHALRRGFLPLPSFLPASASWLELGELDKIRVFFHHEYYRAITALTLHADSSHLAGNIFFGSIFLLILSRLIGWGRAFFFTMLGGIAGNMLSLFFHKSVYVSIGFSSALFASVGVMGGVMMLRAYDKRHLLLAAGGAIGLLALLGTAGDHTDYAAHVGGLICGALCGLYEGWREKRHLPTLPQALLALFALLLPFIAWLFAFDFISLAAPSSVS